VIEHLAKILGEAGDKMVVLAISDERKSS